MTTGKGTVYETRGNDSQGDMKENRQEDRQQGEEDER